AAYIGSVQRILVDGTDGEWLTGRTDGGRLVRFKGDPASIGTFLNARITSSNTWALYGERADTI
ncbi:MAG: TRAM domain-containing protein, partial [bacterium]